MPAVMLTATELVERIGRALYGITPEDRLQALRELAADGGQRGDARRQSEIAETLARAAQSDDSPALREIAAEYLARCPAPEAFDAWLRLTLPEAAESVPDAAQPVADWLGSGGVDLAEASINRPLGESPGARLERARRALRLSARLRDVLARDPNGALSGTSRNAAIRLAERALVELEDASGQAAARALLRELRGE